MTDVTMLPNDLILAMRERDEAFYSVDPVKWGKYTSIEFTTVQQNGKFYSRDDRVRNLRMQNKRSYLPRVCEQFEQQGDLVVTRFLSGGLWVVEVWKRVEGQWATVMTQATQAASATT